MTNCILYWRINLLIHSRLDVSHCSYLDILTHWVKHSYKTSVILATTLSQSSTPPVPVFLVCSRCDEFPRWWDLMCLDMLLFCREVKGQKEHERGFSPVWPWMCVRSEALRVVRAGQYGQRKGFSPVWVRMWRCRLMDTLVLYQQYGHWCFFATDVFGTVAVGFLMAPWTCLLPLLSQPREPSSSPLTCWGRLTYLTLPLSTI